MNFVFVNLLQRSANYISCANLTFNYILKIKFEWNTVLTIPVFSMTLFCTNVESEVEIGSQQ